MDQTRRGRVIGLWESGVSASAIAAEVDISLSTAKRWISRFREDGIVGLEDHRRGNGAARRTTPAEDQAIVAQVRTDPFQAATIVGPTVGVAASPWIIRARLKEVGLRCRRAAKKIDITNRHREDRISFALQGLTITDEEWSSIVFTDEKVFSSDKDGRLNVWREDGERYNRQNVVAGHRSGRVTSAYWGWISAAGPGELVKITRNMNAEQYIDILENALLPSVRAIYPAQDMPIIRIVEDNSAVHRARSVQDWYTTHPEVQRLDWPAKSPDLNPIENCWAEMVRGWRPVAREREEGLSLRVEAKWEELRTRPEYFEAIVGSMHRRMHSVLENDGWWTHY